MIDPTTRKMMLKACPRCHGDLLFDSYEEDFACMQCGRHFGTAAVLASQATPQTVKQDVPAPALAA
ncbi:MAG: hypothetical protein AB7P33_02890 [Dehalococcoidia bacterium]